MDLNKALKVLNDPDQTERHRYCGTWVAAQCVLEAYRQKYQEASEPESDLDLQELENPISELKYFTEKLDPGLEIESELQKIFNADSNLRERALRIANSQPLIAPGLYADHIAQIRKFAVRDLRVRKNATG